jgi:hypothetical protein
LHASATAIRAIDEQMIDTRAGHRRVERLSAALHFSRGKTRILLLKDGLQGRR